MLLDALSVGTTAYLSRRRDRCFVAHQKSTPYVFLEHIICLYFNGMYTWFEYTQCTITYLEYQQTDNDTCT